ncbi:MAG: hypothetical protein A4E53_04392 [Pelotomaculum sp. PtaB.Bin104]|nr:MAG: hypothetical protein A4E53_04392 [Pelotomaculum sp. PtaB.Bin104]
MSLGLGSLIIFLLTPSTWRKRVTLMTLSVLAVELLSLGSRQRVWKIKKTAF